MAVQHRGSETLLELTDGPTLPSGSRIPRSAAREPLMNIAEVAERLGVTVRHMRRLVTEARVPYIKWGHLLRFDPAEIEEWVDRARHGR